MLNQEDLMNPIPFTTVLVKVTSPFIEVMLSPGCG